MEAGLLSCSERVKAKVLSCDCARDQHLEDLLDQFYRVLLMTILWFRVFTLFLIVEGSCITIDG